MKSKLINKIINNKKVNFSIGIIGILLSIFSIIFAHSQIPQIDLCFAEMPEMTISSCLCFEKKLKIFWREKEIKNVKIKRLAFWNNGNQYIDDNLLKDKIRISSTKKCEILDIIDLKLSRKNLKLVFDPWQVDISTIQKNNLSYKEKSDTVFIVIPQKETLEPNDGISFSLIYSSEEVCNFVFAADIKGKLSAFRKIETTYWYFFNTKVEFLLLFLFVLIPYLFGLKGIFFPSYSITNYLKTKFKSYDKNITVFFTYLIFIYKIILIPILSYLLFKLFFIIYNIISIPNWI
jgi:hypothetical protein